MMVFKWKSPRRRWCRWWWWPGA